MSYRTRRRIRRWFREWGLLVLAMLIVVVTGAAMYLQWRACDDRGQKTVRGILWFECVD